jgi:hypothetical protein
MNMQVENAAKRFVAELIARDSANALSRAYAMRRSYSHSPKWLNRAIEMLEADEQSE